MDGKVTYNCERCGKEVTVYRSQYKKAKRHFCGRACNMATMNEELNPQRMTDALKQKIGAARLGTGKQEGYTKIKGRHQHRTAAENKLGRKLKKGEIVHHIDGNKKNNEPNNLMIFKSQSDHVKWHVENDPNFGRKSKGGDAK